jgi:hypothetical protein
MTIAVKTNTIETQTVTPVVAPVKRGRGRPKGSKNKPKAAASGANSSTARTTEEAAV